MKQVTISGMIATHSRAPFPGTIIINPKTGLIEKVRTGRVLNATYTYSDEYLIFPGFTDVHIHAREDDTGKQNYKEDYETAAAAALQGGVVCACAMPNTPNPVTGKTQMAWHRNRLKQLKSAVTILNYLGIDKHTKPIGKPGDYCYKLYFGKSVGDLTVTYGSELEEILARYRGHHVSFHVEYEPIVQASAGGRTHTDRRPVAAVNEGLRILLPLIEKYRIKAKLCHWSTGGESFAMIQEYRNRGCDIVLEVSPLHLYFDTSMTDADPELWTKIQMNPAIQSAEHRAALIEGLRTGFVQFIATDHAPHTEEEKFSAFAKFRDDYPGKSNVEIAALVKTNAPELYQATCVENNHSGAPWLDTYGLVCAWLMNTRGFTAKDIARVSAFLPGQFVNRFLPKQVNAKAYGKGFGRIAPGYLGSLTVLNMNAATTVRREMLRTKVGWSALEGQRMPGSIAGVFVRGVYHAHQ